MHQNLAAKSDLASLQVEVDKIDMYKQTTFSADLSKRRNVGDNDIVYDTFVTKVNAIDTSGFVFEMQYNTDKLGIEKKIDGIDKNLDTGERFGKTDCNGKVIEIKSKIHSITGLAATTRYLALVI